MSTCTIRRNTTPIAPKTWRPYATIGGRFLVRGGTFENPEGRSKPRNVVIEFPSYQAAVDCYHSHEHNRAVAKRVGGADVDFIVIEGYDGEQP